MRMKFNSQLFWKLIALCAILDLTLLATGCGNWESTVTSLLSLLPAALTVVMQILTSLGVAISPSFVSEFESWASQAQNVFATIESLIAQFKTAAASAQAGIIEEIKAALSTLASNLTTLLGELHIVDPATQAKVEAVFATITAVFTSILNLLPTFENALAGAEVDEHDLATKYTSFKETAKGFESNFNNAAKELGEFKIAA